MVIFHSYVSLPEGISVFETTFRQSIMAGTSPINETVDGQKSYILFYI